MKILFAYDTTDHDNEFVRIHIGLLKELGHEVTASLHEFWHPTTEYDFVIINWPDYFYGFRGDITDEEVEKFNDAIENLRKTKPKIITFYHDEYSHYGRNPNLNLLYDICYDKTDIMLHLGEYSKHKDEKIYDRAVHLIMHHPLYREYSFGIEKKKARSALPVRKAKFLVIVPGAIRKKEEIDYCISIYRKLDIPNKKLVFLRSYFYTYFPKINSFFTARKWVKNKYFSKYYKYFGNIRFRSGYLKPEELSNWLAGSDLVIIPRTDILNSGVIFMTAQYGKPMIGTGFGNMGELLDFLGQKKIKDPRSVDKKELMDFIASQKGNSEKLKEKVAEYSSDEKLKQEWIGILDGFGLRQAQPDDASTSSG